MISVLNKVLFASHPKHLWKRYVVAVAVIAALLGTAHVTATLALQASAKNAELINLAGRQRMFSQRIMYLGLRASHHTEPIGGDHHGLVGHTRQACARASIIGGAARALCR